MIEKSVGESSGLRVFAEWMLGEEEILEGCACSVAIVIARIAAIHTIFSKPNTECTCEDAILFDESDLWEFSAAMWRMGVPRLNYRAPILKRIPVQKSTPGEGIPKRAMRLDR
jgi:hypothetical protein